MLRYLYTLIYYLCAPLLCIRWIYKSFKPPQYREPMRERFGFVARQKQQSIWFHAVSMGESIAAKAIIEELLDKQPELNIVVTTTTPTGAQQIIEGLGDKVTHHFSPCDLPGTIKRFVKRAKPKALVIMETELWPNWLYHMQQSNTPVILANARMSQNSADKYSKISSLSQSMMGSLSSVLAVCEQDASRFVQLGVKDERCVVTGNIKFDQAFDINAANGYFPSWNGHHTPIWLAASTHRGEDEIILSAHKKVMKQLPHAKLIIVPRHPERFDEVASLIQGHGFNFARRSKTSTWSDSVDVLLGDTMGELMMAYQLCDVAFVAGSLVPIGGHNMIEPAMLSKPVISGPYVHNFQEIFRELEQAGGAMQVGSGDNIHELVVGLLKNQERRESVGHQAKVVVEKSRGALDRTVKALEPFL
ncbi:3-deoxy-D-manno-octulosonic acid transferase [Kangiella sp. HD9-110m-PIT-SAG07]|nr:3-deoxy-D-manno-octulosonic acid transferase [Kangiella sp. HD9-110m-PIT-SAG07]